MRSTKHPFLFLACIAMVLAAISCQAVSDLAEEKPAAASEEPLQAAPSDTPVPAAALEAEETAAPTQAEVTATAVPASPTAEPPTPAPPTATETAAPQATEPPTAAAPAAGPGACSPEPCTSDGFFLLGRPIGAGGRNTIDPSNRFGSYQRRTREAHHGVDFLNSSGTPVLAAADGVVVVAGDDLQTSYGPHTNTYGNLVILEHNLPGFDLPLFSLYAHLSQISVQSGDAVSSGQEIGRVGMSGSVFGSTLHFEVRLGENSYGSVRNPELWLAPLPDESGQPMGALAGQVVDANGKQLPVSNILVERLGGPGQPALDQIYLKTYSDLRLAGLEPLAESFAAADLPAGPYQITFWLNNREQQRLVEIQPGLSFINAIITVSFGSFRSGQPGEGVENMAQADSDLPKLASPAQRALAGAGITRLKQLTRMSEAELAKLHGIGPNAIKTLRLALEERGLSFLPPVIGNDGS